MYYAYNTYTAEVKMFLSEKERNNFVLDNPTDWFVLSTSAMNDILKLT